LATSTTSKTLINTVFILRYSSLLTLPRAFDAYTGDPLFNVTGVPTGTAVVGSNGEQLKLIWQTTATQPTQ